MRSVSRPRRCSPSCARATGVPLQKLVFRLGRLPDLPDQIKPQPPPPKLLPLDAIPDDVARELARVGSDALREKLKRNAGHFRRDMTKLGFKLAGAGHPIIPVMLGDASLAQQMAAKMLERGIYVIGFSFPVVPKGQARIRTQMSAAHSPADIDRAVDAFVAVGRELGVVA